VLICDFEFLNYQEYVLVAKMDQAFGLSQRNLNPKLSISYNPTNSQK